MVSFQYKPQALWPMLVKMKLGSFVKVNFDLKFNQIDFKNICVPNWSQLKNVIHVCNYFWHLHELCKLKKNAKFPASTAFVFKNYKGQCINKCGVVSM